MRCRSAEADVEHAVGFVQHHVLHLVEHGVLGLDVVQQTPRRGHQDFDALFLDGLGLHVDAANTTALRRLCALPYSDLWATWSASSRVGNSPGRERVAGGRR